MKNKSNPFVSISDLMAGVTAVVMLFLVVSALQVIAVKKEQEAQEAEAKRQMQELAEKHRDRVKDALERIRFEVEKRSLQNIIAIDTSNNVISLSENSFPAGKACIDPKVKNVLDAVSPIFIDVLKDSTLNVNIQFEGHTDPRPVNKDDNACARFDDNYSLSAVRAREARKIVLASVADDKDILPKVSVTGYGPDRLKNTVETNAPENRRVEIRLVSNSKF